MLGGGAGNPGGNGHGTNSLNKNYGNNGTGGLLIIYANEIKNNLNIASNGANGGEGNFGGGASGGGSINIFYKTKYEDSGTIQVYGGSGSGSEAKGGAGGTGSISIGNISTGTYESTYKNY